MPPALRHVLDRRFRANAAFELVAPDRLPVGCRPALGAEAGAQVLVPRAGGPLTAKVLNASAAELVAGLREPGALPAGARGAEVNAAVARLVLDGALEIESRGGFVSGPPAHPVVFEDTARRPAAGRSLEAIRYGARLALDDVGALSRRLYGYGALPRNARWDALAGPADDLAPLLGTSAVAREYEPVPNPSWLAWSRGDGDDLPYKLYVSPLPHALIECFGAVAAVLAEHEVGSFKIGRGVAGVLRPDKLVAYVESRDALERLASALAAALAGCPAHGVPFTAEISPDGLLSWGMDPPSWERVLDRPESWRLWVTNRLAGALIHARAAGGVDPAAYALDRLALESIDPATWLPSDTFLPRA